LPMIYVSSESEQTLELLKHIYCVHRSAAVLAFDNGAALRIVQLAVTQRTFN